MEKIKEHSGPKMRHFLPASAPRGNRLQVSGFGCIHGLIHSPAGEIKCACVRLPSSMSTDVLSARRGT